MSSSSKWTTCTGHFLYLCAFLTVTGGFLVHLVAGSVNHTFGNIAPYVISYIQKESHPSGLKQETVTWVLACMYTGQGIAGFLGGWMADIIGPRRTIFIGGIIVISSVSMSYFAIKVSFWLLLVTYGIVQGVGVGVILVAPITAAMKWMPNWKGLASSAVLTGYGLSTFIFSAVQTIYINPNNKQTILDENGQKTFNDPDLLSRVPSSFILLAFLYGALIFTGCLLITDPPEGYSNDQQTDEMGSKVTQYLEVDDNGELQKANNILSLTSTIRSIIECITTGYSSKTKDDSDDESESVSSIDDKSELLSSDAQASGLKDYKMEESLVTAEPWNSDDVISLTPQQVLRRPYFYVLTLIYLFGCTITIIVYTNYKLFGETFINDDHFLTTVGVTASLFSIFGRILWGLIFDYFLPYKLAMVLIFSIQTVFMLTLYACILGGKIMFLIWMCVIYSCIGGKATVIPVAVGHAYGLQYASTIYGIIVLSDVLAGPLSALLPTVLSMHYTALFFGTSFLSGLAFNLSIIYKPKLYIALHSGDI